MMSTIRSAVAGLALASFALLPAGCVAVVAAGAAGAGVLYHKGALKVSAHAEPPAVAAATVKTFQQMSIPVLSQESTALDARVVGRNAAGDEIKVTVERQSQGSSTVWIRIGTFGDEADSLAIWERIQANL